MSVVNVATDTIFAKWLAGCEASPRCGVFRENRIGQADTGFGTVVDGARLASARGAWAAVVTSDSEGTSASASVGTFDGVGGQHVSYHSWVPQEVRAGLQIVHGMGDHAARYADFARFLNRHGIAVYAADHRGHGPTATTLGVFGEDGWNLLNM